MKSPEQKVLLVDDDDSVLYIYQKVLEDECAIHTAHSANQALEMLAADGPYAAIISDFQMPGTDGLHLLSRVRELHRETVRVMMTSLYDLQIAVDAVNQGNVFRFLCKPCPESTLRACLRAALDQYRLIVSERELLEKTLTGTIKVLTDVLGLVNPVAFSRSQSVTRYVRHVVSDLGLMDGWRLEAAAMLSQLGCVTVYPDTMEALFAGKPVSQHEREKFSRHPMIARQLLERIPRLEYVAALIGLQTEAVPGSPSSSKFEHDSIQYGSQILKTCIEFDRLVCKGESPQTARTTLEKRSHNDNSITESLGRMPLALLPYEAKCLPADGLSLKMILDQDVCTTNGVLLVAKGAEVTEPLLLRLQNFHARGNVQGEIRVLIPKDSLLK